MQCASFHVSKKLKQKGFLQMGANYRFSRLKYYLKPVLPGQLWTRLRDQG